MNTQGDVANADSSQFNFILFLYVVNCSHSVFFLFGANLVHNLLQ